MSQASRLKSLQARVRVPAPANSYRGGWVDTFRNTVLTQLLATFNQQGSSTGWTYIDYNAGPDKWDISRSVRRQWGINPVFDYGRAMSVLRHKDERVFMGHPFLGLMRRVREVNDDAEAENDNDNRAPVAKLVPGFKYYPSTAALLKPIMREQDRAILCEKDPEYFHRLQQYVGRDHRFKLLNVDVYEELSAARSDFTGHYMPISIPQRMKRQTLLMEKYLAEVEQLQAKFNHAFTESLKTPEWTTDPEKAKQPPVPNPTRDEAERAADAALASGKMSQPAHVAMMKELDQEATYVQDYMKFMGLLPRDVIQEAKDGKPELLEPLPVPKKAVHRDQFATNEEYLVAKELAHLEETLAARQSAVQEQLVGSGMNQTTASLKAMLDTVQAKLRRAHAAYNLQEHELADYFRADWPEQADKFWLKAFNAAEAVRAHITEKTGKDPTLILNEEEIEKQIELYDDAMETKEAGYMWDDEFDEHWEGPPMEGDYWVDPDPVEYPDEYDRVTYGMERSQSWYEWIEEYVNRKHELDVNRQYEANIQPEDFLWEHRKEAFEEILDRCVGELEGEEARLLKELQKVEDAQLKHDTIDELGTDGSLHLALKLADWKRVRERLTGKVGPEAQVELDRMVKASNLQSQITKMLEKLPGGVAVPEGKKSGSTPIVTPSMTSAQLTEKWSQLFERTRAAHSQGKAGKAELAACHTQLHEFLDVLRAIAHTASADAATAAHAKLSQAEAVKLLEQTKWDVADEKKHALALQLVADRDETALYRRLQEQPHVEPFVPVWALDVEEELPHYAEFMRRLGKHEDAMLQLEDAIDDAYENDEFERAEALEAQRVALEEQDPNYQPDDNTIPLPKEHENSAAKQQALADPNEDIYDEVEPAQDKQDDLKSAEEDANETVEEYDEDEDAVNEEPLEPEFIAEEAAKVDLLDAETKERSLEAMAQARSREEEPLRRTLAYKAQADAIDAFFYAMSPAEFLHWQIGQLEAQLAKADAQRPVREIIARDEAVAAALRREKLIDAATLASILDKNAPRPTLEAMEVFLQRAKIHGRFPFAFAEEEYAYTLANTRQVNPEDEVDFDEPKEVDEEAEALGIDEEAIRAEVDALLAAQTEKKAPATKTTASTAAASTTTGTSTAADADVAEDEAEADAAEVANTLEQGYRQLTFASVGKRSANAEVARLQDALLVQWSYLSPREQAQFVDHPDQEMIDADAQDIVQNIKRLQNQIEEAQLRADEAPATEEKPTSDARLRELEAASERIGSELDALYASLPIAERKAFLTTGTSSSMSSATRARIASLSEQLNEVQEAIEARQRELAPSPTPSAPKEIVLEAASTNVTTSSAVAKSSEASGDLLRDLDLPVDVDAPLEGEHLQAAQLDLRRLAQDATDLELIVQGLKAQVEAPTEPSQLKLTPVKPVDAKATAAAKSTLASLNALDAKASSDFATFQASAAYARLARKERALQVDTILAARPLAHAAAIVVKEAQLDAAAAHVKSDALEQLLAMHAKQQRAEAIAIRKEVNARLREEFVAPTIEEFLGEQADMGELEKEDDKLSAEALAEKYRRKYEAHVARQKQKHDDAQEELIENERLRRIEEQRQARYGPDLRVEQLRKLMREKAEAVRSRDGLALAQLITANSPTAEIEARVTELKRKLRDLKRARYAHLIDPRDDFLAMDAAEELAAEAEAKAKALAEQDRLRKEAVGLFVGKVDQQIARAEVDELAEKMEPRGNILGEILSDPLDRRFEQETPSDYNKRTQKDFNKREHPIERAIKAEIAGSADSAIEPSVANARKLEELEKQDIAWGVIPNYHQPKGAPPQPDFMYAPKSPSTHFPVNLPSALAKPLTAHAIVGIDIAELVTEGAGREGDIAEVDGTIAQATKTILEQTIHRFPHATYMITYPIFGRGYQDDLLSAVMKSGVRNILQGTFHLQKGEPYDTASRVYDFEPWGCGVIVVRPPPGFEKTLKDIVNTMNDVMIAYGPSIHTVEEEEAIAHRTFPKPADQAMATFFVDQSIHWEKGWPNRPNVSWMTEQIDDHIKNLHSFKWEHFLPSYENPRSKRFELLARQRSDLESDLWNYSRGFRGEDEEANQWLYRYRDLGQASASKFHLQHEGRQQGDRVKPNERPWETMPRVDLDATATGEQPKKRYGEDGVPPTDPEHVRNYTADLLKDQKNPSEDVASADAAVEFEVNPLNKYASSRDVTPIASVDWGLVRAQTRAAERLRDQELAFKRDLKRTHVFDMMARFQRGKIAQHRQQQTEAEQRAQAIEAAKKAGTYVEPEVAAAATKAGDAQQHKGTSKRRSPGLAQQIHEDARYQELLEQYGQRTTSYMAQPHLLKPKTTPPQPITHQHPGPI